MTTIDISNCPKSATISQWSRIIEYSPATLYRHIQTGKLEATRKLNGTWRVSREAICDMLDITPNKTATASK